MTAADELRCPVCRAKFRGAVACGRCGVDLAPCMRLVRDAWRARGRARDALASGDFEAAAREARLAQELAATTVGARLERAVALIARAAGR